MLKNLEDIIISEINLLENEFHEKKSKKIEKKISEIYPKIDKLKYNNHKNNRLKTFFFDIFNHGFSYHVWFLAGMSFLTALALFLGRIAFYTGSDLFFGENILLSLMGSFGFIVLTTVIIKLMLEMFYELPTKTYEYMCIDKLMRNLNNNEDHRERSINCNGKIFNEGNTYYYQQIPISKVVLDETIKNLSEDQVKELLKSGDKKCIYYKDLIKMIKNIKGEMEVSELYNKIKDNVSI